MKKRLAALQQCLEQGLIERETPIRLALLSALAGEHLLLIGAPGTAKSVLARRLHLAFQDKRYFERLLTRFSVPEELFGPLSINALQDDRYERLTTGYLPNASIAFIDEVFKANSAILNALLTLLNEREFDNGQHRLKTPLITVIAASNELPQEEELAALYDRFLCRYEVKAISAKNFHLLLNLPNADVKIPDPSLPLSNEEILQLQQNAEAVILADEVIQLLQALRDYLTQQQMFVSDRRWHKLVKLLKVSAYSNERNAVSIWDCCLLEHCLWDEPQQRKIIAEWLQNHLGIGSGFNQARLEKLVQVWESALHNDQHSTEQKSDTQGNLLYHDSKDQESVNAETRLLAEDEGEALYLAPPDQEDRSNQQYGYRLAELQKQFFDDVYQQCHIEGAWQHIDAYIAKHSNRLIHYHKNSPIMLAKRHEQSFLDSRLRETQHILDNLDSLRHLLEQQLLSLDEYDQFHLWLTPDVIKMAKSSLTIAFQASQSLQQRVQIIVSEYGLLKPL
jgi:MoxR-like ATPase